MGPKNPENAAQPAQEETYELLTTKLAPPRLRPLFVPRQALLARLDGGLEHKLTLISAPAGFGKTTLVSEWIAFHRERHNLPRLAWVALDPGRQPGCAEIDLRRSAERST
jgi:ATP/maltotriose-dependent transcriptional regulator MalT